MMSPLIFMSLVVLVYMSLWYVIAIFLKRNDVADIAWGMGFVLLAWSSWYFGSHSELGFIISLLVTLWGVRLSWHIFQRNRKKEEDYRYQEWRRTWKLFYLRSYLQVFVLQGIFMYMIALPFLSLNFTTTFFETPWMPLGIVVWIIGYYFEVMGDLQLKRFISKPENKGKLMTSGLWAITRHPNYFGEVTQWWGIFLLVFGATLNPLLIVGPLTITWLILFVSGVPLLEKKYEGRADWEAYKKKVNKFFPGL